VIAANIYNSATAPVSKSATGFASAPVCKSSIYLRLSVTNRCNLRCSYCRPPSLEQDIEQYPSATDRELLELVRIVNDTVPIHKLRLTGGEPLLHPRVTELMTGIRDLLPKTEFCLTTNGTLLAKKAQSLRAAGLDSLNISLDTLHPGKFQKLSGGGSLDDTIAGIGAAGEIGFTNLKINSVLIRGINADGLADLVRFAARKDCEIRFIELMPYGQGAALFLTDYHSAEEAFNSLNKVFSCIGPVASTSTARRYRFLVDGKSITVGFITPVSQPFCSKCDRLRISHNGRLFACLRQQQNIDILALLRSGDWSAIGEHVTAAISGKHDPGGYWPEHDMVSIGG
jgi:GTP 3',8-cyclase